MLPRISLAGNRDFEEDIWILWNAYEQTKVHRGKIFLELVLAFLTQRQDHAKQCKCLKVCAGSPLVLRFFFRFFFLISSASAIKMGGFNILVSLNQPT